MRRHLLIAASLLALLSPAKAADSTVAAYTAASAFGGTELLYLNQGGADRKGTTLQMATYMEGLASGDCTYNSSTHVITCTKTNGVAFGALATVTPGTGVAALLAGASSGTGAPLGGTAPTMSSPIINTAATFGFITGSTQCLHVNTSGVLSGTGSDCGAGGGGTPANPTATASDVAVNGVASTYMRSDAAPAVQKTSASQFGVVKLDGTTLNQAGGVASVTTGCGLSAGSSGITTNASINPQTGTSYTVVSGDCGSLVSFNNASPVAVTLAAATGSFGSGWYSTFINLGAGLVTITGGSNIDGSSTITLKQFQSADIISNGSVYITARGRPTSVACGDLTNSGTACQAATGSSGGTVPFLNGTNIWSAVQTFNANDLKLAGVTGSTQCLHADTTGVVTGTGSDCGAGGGGTPANPTATAGPTAVNGVASTYMRSDAAPAVQLATNAQKGIVQVDGATIVAASGVASVQVKCGLSADSAGIGATLTPRNNTLTTDTIAGTDCGALVTENNASAVSVAIAQAGTTGFEAGKYFSVKNKGAGLVTITPTTSTIDVATIKQGQQLDFYSDGTNYIALPGRPTNVACGDLTNSGTACQANTGTSGHTLPFLDGNNAHSGTETFGSVLGTVTSQSGTTYTFAASDCGTEVTFTNGSAVTATIPQTLPVGCNIAVLQAGAGQVSVNGSAVAAATLHSAHSYTKTFGQWAIIGINIEANAGGSSAIAILTGDGA